MTNPTEVLAGVDHVHALEFAQEVDYASKKHPCPDPFKWHLARAYIAQAAELVLLLDVVSEAEYLKHSQNCGTDDGECPNHKVLAAIAAWREGVKV